MKERDLPSAARGGVLIEKVDPQPVVRKTAEVSRDWEYGQILTDLNNKNEILYPRFFNGVLRPGFDPDHSLPLLSVDNLRNIRTLAAYQLVPDEYGFNRKIILNEQHFIESEEGRLWAWGLWALMETMTHEDTHDWQQLRGKDPFKQGKVTHNNEFCDKLESLGIHPTPNHGAHYAIADKDGPFGILMQEFGIQRPTDVVVPPPKKDWFRWEEGKERKGTSTLSKYECPECHLKVRVGIKGDPEIIHGPCTLKKGDTVFFIRMDGLAQATLGMAGPLDEHKEKYVPVSDGEKVQEPTDKVLKPGETVNISEEAGEELDKEFERRRDWNAFYKDKYGPYPGSEAQEYEPDYGDMYDL